MASSRTLVGALGAAFAVTLVAGASAAVRPDLSRSQSSGSAVRVQEYSVPAGSHPHDVAPASDGTVWYTAQATGKLGRLDPATGQTTEVPLGEGSAPHGVIVGPDGAPWVTDGGLNAIVRVDPGSSAFRGYRLPAHHLDRYGSGALRAAGQPASRRFCRGSVLPPADGARPVAG